MIPRLTNPPLHASLAEIPEPDLVRQLLAAPHWHQWLFGLPGMPEQPRVLQMVDLRHAPGGFAGDVDILLVAPDQPTVATAIEVKRLKVSAAAFTSGRPNKLQEYDKGVEQANLLAEVAFAQVYLYVIVVVDSRVRNEGRYTYDGLTPELTSAIQARISLERLAPSVGLVVHEFAQPMDHPPLALAPYAGHLKRLATVRVQPADLTKWIIGVLDGAA
jgi:hypothetical protein